MVRNHEPGNHTQTTALAPGVFFYHHIAKTAGTSWSVDIAKVGGLSHCGTAHLVGPDSVDRLGRSINFSVRNGRLGESISSVEPAGRRQRRTRYCNLFNREGVLASSVQRFSLQALEPKLILLLRHPVTHVRSMYSHCQAPTGVVRRRKEESGSHSSIGFAEWLSL